MPPSRGSKVQGSTLISSKMYSPPNIEGKKFEMVVSSASAPNFQELRLPSRLKVSAKWIRFSSVCRGRIVERPNPSKTSVMRVLTLSELLNDSCRSRENCARKWLFIRHEMALVSDSETLSVLTSSCPFSLSANVVTGLAGSKKTLLVPSYRDVLNLAERKLRGVSATSSLRKPVLPSSSEPKVPAIVGSPCAAAKT